MKTLGIYGPKYPEKTGVADYIDLTKNALRKHFDCIHISNDDWTNPKKFDYVLYHIGSSIRHACVFKALSIRPGAAMIHEYNCLEYYYDNWRNLDQYTRNVIIQKFARVLNRNFRYLSDVMRFFDDHNEYDRYSVEIGIEEIFLEHISIGVLHSSYNVKLLRNRYPQKRFSYILHPARRLMGSNCRGGRDLLDLNDSHFLFGTFGFIGYQKRVDKIVEAWVNWRDRPKEAKLLIVGQQQDPVEIPNGHGIIYLGYVEDINLFVTYLAAVDCGIQLRYPTFGETSGVITQFVANNKRVIVSKTASNSIYVNCDNVAMIEPDDNEIANLILEFNNVIKCKRLPIAFNPDYSLMKYCHRITEVIKDCNEI